LLLTAAAAASAQNVSFIYVLSPKLN